MHCHEHCARDLLPFPSLFDMNEYEKKQEPTDGMETITRVISVFVDPFVDQQTLKSPWLSQVVFSGIPKSYSIAGVIAKV